MAKITFPTAGLPPIGNKGNISKLREHLTYWASYLQRSPGSKADVAAQISAMLNYSGLTPTLPAAQAIVSNGQQLTIPVTGTYATKATVTVTAGAVTAIVLS